MTVTLPNDRSVLPFSKINYWKGARTGIRIDKSDVDDIAEKWTRGIHYCTTGDFIEDSHDIYVHILPNPVPPEIADVQKHATNISRDKTVQIYQAYVQEDGTYAAMYGFKIWASFEVHTIVAPQTAPLPDQ
jgi:hypothetical protein